MKLNTWRELVEIIPEEYREENKDIFRTIFSICARKFWIVNYNGGDKIEISKEHDGIKAWTTFLLPAKNVTYDKGSVKITLNKIQYPNGFVFDVPYRSTGISDYCIVRSDNTMRIITGTYKCASQLLSMGNDVVNITTHKGYKSSLVYSSNFRKLEWHEAHSYACYLCIKDIGPYQKGMIVDMYKFGNYGDGGNGESPLKKFDDLYGVIFTVACNLNLVTMDDLHKINVKSFSCRKQRYGCQLGCLNNCTAEGANSRNNWLKGVYINLYKEVFG